jgi:hypothetical protein
MVYDSILEVFNMKCIKWINDRIKKFDWLDMGFIKLAVAAFVLMVAKLWAPVLYLNWYWYLVLFLVFAIKPVCRMCRK